MVKTTEPDSTKEALLSLVRLGIGQSADTFPEVVDWNNLKVFAEHQWLLAIMLDGIEKLPADKRPPKKELLHWIGFVMKDEARFAEQRKYACEMALLFHENGIRSYVLKGEVVAECYPKQEHRGGVDMDCFLIEDSDVKVQNDDVWEKGNSLIEEAGYKVGRGFYKNSSFHFPGLMVENHRFLVPFRGNKTLSRLERLLQSDLCSDKGVDRFEGTWLYRPPVMVSALFLIEHAYSHFLHEGLTWRHVLDWMMYSRKHKADIDWTVLDDRINEFGFRKFYNSFFRIGQFLLGEIKESELIEADQLMMADVWDKLDLHESLNGMKAKFQLAGNYWRARWKYRLFTDMTWVRALLEWVFGAVLNRQPRL